MYEYGFEISKLFGLYTLGLISKRDKLVTCFTLNEVNKNISYFIDQSNSVEQVCDKFDLQVEDKDRWNAKESICSIKDDDIESYLKNIVYRPLDNRVIFYHDKFIARPNKNI